MSPLVDQNQRLRKAFVPLGGDFDRAVSFGSAKETLERIVSVSIAIAHRGSGRIRRFVLVQVSHLWLRAEELDAVLYG
jgi:hypothetical protein